VMLACLKKTGGNDFNHILENQRCDKLNITKTRQIKKEINTSDLKIIQFSQFEQL